MEVWVLVHNRLEFILAEAISINVVKRSVEEFGLVAEEVLITTNDSLVTKLHMEVFLVLMAKPNTVLAILLLRLLKVFRDHVDLLVYFLIFFENILLNGVEARLQVLQKSDHELGVLSVLPCVEASLLRTL